MQQCCVNEENSIFPDAALEQQRRPLQVLLACNEQGSVVSHMLLRSLCRARQRMCFLAENPIAIYS